MIESSRKAGRRTRIAAGAAIAMVGLLAMPAVAQKTPTIMVQGHAVSFDDGSQLRQHVMVFDELQVLGVADADAISRAADRVVSVADAPGADGAKSVRLRDVADAASLQSVARSLAASAPGAKVFAVLTDPEVRARGERPRRILTRQIVATLAPGKSVDDVVAAHGLAVVRKAEWRADTWVLESSSDSLLASVEAKDALLADGSAIDAVPQVSRLAAKRLAPNDPFFADQWHHLNTGSHPSITGEVAGNDINIATAWDSVLGAGVNIAISDDGLETTHEDLSANVRTDIDIDINFNDADPSPGSGDDHGTACAGMAAARGNNSVGVTGAAPQAGLVGIRLIAAGTTDAQEAQAMLHQATPANAADRVHVNSNSWGPFDTGDVLEGPGSSTAAALESGTTNGRGGLGILYCWAGGNGLPDDDSNYDGYANNRHVIGVAASGADGEQSYYSESGANILVNAPSSFDGGGTTTVDRTGANGYNTNGTGGEPADTNYTYSFGGTSSAAPLVAGVVGLVLSANPNLTWRDVQHIFVETAHKNDPTDTGWDDNGAGFHFNHKYGFGRIDATAAVAAAQTWVNVPAWQSTTSFAESVTTAIPDNNTTGITRTITVSGVSAGFVIERVEFTVSATHPYRGDLRWRLTSPQGTLSLVPDRDDAGNDYAAWTFTSVAPWGENPNGTWTLNVADVFATDTGSLTSWSLKFWGHEASAASSASSWTLY